jgi:hypothetical protein
MDLNQQQLLGQKDWVAAQKQFKQVRDDWQKRFR